MAMIKAKKGSDLISSAAAIVGGIKNPDLLESMVVRVDLSGIYASLNCASEIKLDERNDKKWGDLLSLCGYPEFSKESITSASFNFFSDSAVNMDINFIGRF